MYMYVYYTGLEIHFFYSLPNGQVALICLAHAGMYSVAFMHYWLPDLQYYLPRAYGQALNVSPDYTWEHIMQYMYMYIPGSTSCSICTCTWEHIMQYMYMYLGAHHAVYVHVPGSTSCSICTCTWEHIMQYMYMYLGAHHAVYVHVYTWEHIMQYMYMYLGAHHAVYVHVPGSTSCSICTCIYLGECICTWEKEVRETSKPTLFSIQTLIRGIS